MAAFVVNFSQTIYVTQKEHTQAMTGRLHRMGTAALLLVLLLASCAALAEPPGETITGAFPEVRYVRVSPDAQSKAVAWVPAGTELTMKPVSDTYATTTYNGVMGYIAYGGMQQAVAGGTVFYSDSVLFAYARPDEGETYLAAFPAQTPVRTLETKDGYASVWTVDGLRYISTATLKPLPDDTTISPYDATLNGTAALLEYPLENADTLAVLTPLSDVRVTAQSMGYLRVELGSKAGYVPKGVLTRRSTQTSSTYFAVLPDTARTFENPTVKSPKGWMEGNTIVEVQEAPNGFARVHKTETYLRASALTPLSAKLIPPVTGYWEWEQPLHADDVKTPIASGTVLSSNTLLELTHRVNGSYLVSVDGQWGLIDGDGVHMLESTRPMNATAACATGNIPLQVAPSADAHVLDATLPSGACLWLDAPVRGFYRVTAGDRVGYVPADTLYFIGENVACKAFEVYVDNEVPLLDFPSSMLAGSAASLPANSLAQVVAVNGTYYYIRHESGEGYVPVTRVRTSEEANNREASGFPRYYLHLNKALRQLTVYRADEWGNRTPEVERTVTVAIGKRTTPTPSGTFTLGAKERWHYFGPSYAPFAIAFTPGRYLHGPLYAAEDEATLKIAPLADFGNMATGGCIRIPYADILWIYFHCFTAETTLEIVNGE